MQNTQTYYVHRQAQATKQWASSPRRSCSPSSPGYDEGLDYDDNIYTYENVDSEC